MGKSHSDNLVSIFASLYAMASLVGCTAQPTLPTPIPEQLNLTELGSVAQTPILPSGRELVVLAPGETITLRTSAWNEPLYLCRTGRPLQCDGLNQMLYCFCPGGR